jgi:phage baseplate assembly protein W
MATLAPFARRFRFPAGVDPLRGRFAEETDYDAYVRGLIRQVLLTAKGERINRPAFGAGVRRLVFAPLSEASAMLARTMIFESLNRWMATLIQVESVEARAEQSKLEITVVYRVIAHGERRYLNEEVVLP